MKRVPFSQTWDDVSKKGIARIVAQAGVLVYPTDTIYGLGGSYFSQTVHWRIDEFKGRSQAPYSAAIGSLKMLDLLVESVPDLFRHGLQQLLPGPYTFILPAARLLDRALIKDRDTIGIRMPNLPPLLDLISASGVPWITTSVNRAGEAPLTDPDEMARRFPGIDLILDAGRMPVRPASTIVDLSLSPPRIVRAGAGVERVQEILAHWR